MYLIAWELGSYRQLSRLEPELIASVEGELHESLVGAGAQRTHIEQGLRLYCFDRSDREAASAVAELVLRLHGVVVRHRAELAGYGVVVDHAQRADDAALRGIRALLRAAPDDEGVWLTSRVASSLEEHVSTESHGQLSRVLASPPRRRTGGGGVRGIAAESSARELVLATMDSWLWGARDYHGALFRGLRPPSDLFVVESALERLMGSPEAWMRVAPPASGRAWPQGFAAEVQESFLSQVPSFLSRTEGAVWSRTRSFLTCFARSSACDDRSDRGGNAFAVAYRLYVVARLRALSRAAIPPVMVVNRIGEIPSAGLHFLDRLLGELSSQEGNAPFIIATGAGGESDEAAPVLTSVSLREVTLLPLQTREIADAARRTLPDSVTRMLRVAAIGEATGGDLVEVYHHFRTRGELVADRDLRAERTKPDYALCPVLSPVSMRFLETLPDCTREVFFLCQCLAGLGDLADLIAVAHGLGYDDREVETAVQELATAGMIRDNRSVRLLLLVDYQQLPDALKARYTTIVDRVGQYFMEEHDAGRRVLDQALYRLISRRMGEQERRAAALKLFERLFYFGNIGACEALHAEERARLDAVPGDLRDPVRHRVMLAVWQLRLALASGSTETAERRYEELPGPCRNSEIDGELHRAAALYNFNVGRIDRATSSIKRAIVAYQAVPDDVGISAANVDYARCLLGRRSVVEALEQLNRGRMPRSTETRERVEIHRELLDAVSSFLYGNFTRAREGVRRLLEDLADEGPREHYLFAVLLQGRLFFEMGSYGSAVDYFAQACTEARRLEHDAALRIFELWIGRAEAYAGSLGSAERRLRAMPGGPERNFFLAEAEWFAGNAQAALDAIEDAHRAELPRGFFTPERPDWSSGFASVEGHLVPKQEVFRKLIRSFRAFLLSRIGRAEDGLFDLREVTRGEQRSRFDPYSGLYCFLYSKLLQELGGSRPDHPVTMLGQSVKIMQERLSRIDSPQDRSCVFEGNFWYEQLIRYARRQNMA